MDYIVLNKHYHIKSFKNVFQREDFFLIIILCPQQTEVLGVSELVSTVSHDH